MGTCQSSAHEDAVTGAEARPSWPSSPQPHCEEGGGGGAGGAGRAVSGRAEWRDGSVAERPGGCPRARVERCRGGIAHHEQGLVDGLVLAGIGVVGGHGANGEPCGRTRARRGSARGPGASLLPRVKVPSVVARSNKTKRRARICCSVRASSAPPSRNSRLRTRPSARSRSSIAHRGDLQLSWLGLRIARVRLALSPRAPSMPPATLAGSRPRVAPRGSRAHPRRRAPRPRAVSRRSRPRRASDRRPSPRPAPARRPGAPTRSSRWRRPTTPARTRARTR